MQPNVTACLIILPCAVIVLELPVLTTWTFHRSTPQIQRLKVLEYAVIDLIALTRVFG